MAGTDSINHEGAARGKRLAGGQHRQEGSVALLSIHPRYVDLIRKGEKSVEFRRRPFARIISHIVIYSTTPVKRLIGVCEVERVVRDTPAALWYDHGDKGGITREALFAYLEGLLTATAIVIRKFIPFTTEMYLPEIGIEHPPQSFQYLNDVAFTSLTQKCT
ncbi:MAG: ASCH domain-containing protein [Dehalococcoidia bacterium]|nr:ASCH domain-containing protein [Dehalococcoidia bacterium]